MSNELIANARMYSVAPGAISAWKRLFAWLAETSGVRLTVIDHAFPALLNDLWARPDLAATFMCGWPWLRHGAKHQVVAAPVPASAYAKGEPQYCTHFVVHRDSRFQQLEDTFGHRFAYTIADSHSGYNRPRHHLMRYRDVATRKLYGEIIGPLTTPRRMMEAIAEKRTDVGPLDSFAYDLLSRHEPALAAQTRVIASTDLVPIPAIMASRDMDAKVIETLRATLLTLGSKPEHAALCTDCAYRASPRSIPPPTRSPSAGRARRKLRVSKLFRDGAKMDQSWVETACCEAHHRVADDVARRGSTAVWLTLTYLHASVPMWLLIPCGAWLTCWHSSLQHEILHGHPTCSGAINRAIAFAPLSLWLPYDRYRATHLQHHHDERLTDPLDDPESRYVTSEDWRRLGLVGQLLVRAQTTLMGRLVIGPFWSIGHFLRDEARDVIVDVPRRRRIWTEHLFAVAMILFWLHFWCAMNLAFYIAVFAIGGTSLMLIRSFAEHRADAVVVKRTAVIEGFGPLAWLYLFNNLHAAHHARPHLSWYRLPAYFRANRSALVDPARGPHYAGYAEVFRLFLVRPHDNAIHPLGRIPVKQTDAVAS